MSRSAVVLQYSKLGAQLMATLKAVVNDPGFAGVVSVAYLPYSNADLMGAALEGAKTVTFTVQYETKHRHGDEGTWYLESKGLDIVNLPDLNCAVTPTDGEDAEQYLESLYIDPPGDGVPYYVGPIGGRVGDELQELFPSGKEVCELGVISGVSTLYCHVGEAASGTAFHCEDAQMRSYNLTIVGIKIWLIIDIRDNDKFEALVKRLTGHQPACDQAIRHAAVMFPPSRLRKEGIQYNIISAAPGDFVVIRPRQYHAVINRTTTFAIATDFVLPRENPIRGRLYVCELDGLRFFKHPSIEPLDKSVTKRKKTMPGSADLAYRAKQPKAGHDGPSRTTRRTNPAAEKQQDTKGREEGTRPVRRRSELVSALLDSVTRAESIRRHRSIIAAWRRVPATVRTELLNVGGCTDKGEQALPLYKVVVACESETALLSLLQVLAGVQLYRNFPRNGRKINSVAIDELAKARELDPERERGAVNSVVVGYRKWDRLCGRRRQCDGVLCFVPAACNAGNIPKTGLKRLSHLDIDAFCSRLMGSRHGKRLCELGMAFQRGVFGQEEFEVRKFELSGARIDTLDVNELMDLLKPAGLNLQDGEGDGALQFRAGGQRRN